MDNIKQELVETKFSIGSIVKHRFLDFRGVIFDVDPEFNNTEEWYKSIPASIRPKKISPFIIYLQKMVTSFMLHMSQSKIYLMIFQKKCQNIQRLKTFFLTLRMVNLFLFLGQLTKLLLRSYLQSSSKNFHCHYQIFYAKKCWC